MKHPRQKLLKLFLLTVNHYLCSKKTHWIGMTQPKSMFSNLMAVTSFWYVVISRVLASYYVQIATNQLKTFLFAFKVVQCCIFSHIYGKIVVLNTILSVPMSWDGAEIGLIGVMGYNLNVTIWWHGFVHLVISYVRWVLNEICPELLQYPDMFNCRVPE